MSKEVVAFTPVWETRIGSMPKTFVEEPDPPVAVRVKTAPPFASVEEVTVTEADPLTERVDVVIPLKVMEPEPPELETLPKV